MRKEFVIFFAVVLSVYGFINGYIYYRAYEAVVRTGVISSFNLSLIAAFILPAYFLGRFLSRKTAALSTGKFKKSGILVARAVSYIGSFWFGMMVYFLMYLFIADIFRITHFVLHIPLPVTYTALFYIASSSALLTGAAGYINARIIRIKRINLPLPDNSGITEEIKFTALSDIHLGIIMSPARLQNIINAVNKTNPRFVVIAGDVFDEDISLVMEERSGELFSKINAPEGVFAVTGNHEYFGGVDRAVEYLRQSGLTVLRDQAITHASGVTLAGRDDLTYNRFSGKKRKTIPELLADVANPSAPVILLDHQPTKLHLAAEANIFLQISGHTHHGQLFPFNYITKRVYELSYGYKKKENTNIYVSCGSGTWGPPMRLGNRPEVIAFTLTPAK